MSYRERHSHGFRDQELPEVAAGLCAGDVEPALVPRKVEDEGQDEEARQEDVHQRPREEEVRDLGDEQRLGMLVAVQHLPENREVGRLVHDEELRPRRRLELRRRADALVVRVDVEDVAAAHSHRRVVDAVTRAGDDLLPDYCTITFSHSILVPDLNLHPVSTLLSIGYKSYNA